MDRQRRAVASKNYKEGDTSDSSDNEDWTKSPPKGITNGTAKTFRRNLDAVMRSPTSAEINQASKNVKDGVATLDKIDKEIAQLRGQLDTLEKRREKVQRDLHLNRSIASNLRNIPDEILSVVFEFYTESGPAANPWVLMGVCRQWRAAAIQARRIWSKIMLTHAKPGGSGSNNRRYDDYEVCHTVPLLQKALDRAAGAPLHISLNFGQYRGSDILGEDDTISRQLVETLQTSGAHLRIHELETKNCSIEWIKRIEFDGFEFPALEKARLTMSSHHLNAKIKKTALRLRWLHLERTTDEELDWESPNVGRIDYLGLCGAGWNLGGRGPLISAKAMRLIHSAPLLTGLYLSYVKVPSISGHGSLSIPSLRDLELVRVEIECSLDLPNLRTLVMTESKLPKSEKNPLFLPSLKSLTISNCGRDSLRDIRAPELHNLEFLNFNDGSKWSHSTLESIIDNRIIPEHLSPRVIRLETWPVRAKQLSKFLSNIPLLEEFTLEGSVISPKDFFEDFAGRSLTTKAPVTRRTPICPSLNSFKLNITSRTIAPSEQANIKWFTQMVQVRKRSRYPINTASYQKIDSNSWTPVF
ncbi:hypothetical protein FRC17_010421 [Serendipita sp. 399]|nr:hypothetical protein FRC17_010421 [Serendipita sp. 399]